MRVVMVCPELPQASRPGSMAPTARQIESLAQMGLQIDTVDMRGIPKLKYLQAIPRVRRLARGADIIHAHYGFCGWLAWIAIRGLRNKPPLVMSFMGDDLLGTVIDAQGRVEWLSRVMVAINRRFARWVSKRIVKSQEMADVLKPLDCHVIANGVDIEKFQPLDRSLARERLGWDDRHTVILFPGDPSNPRKGYQLACEAFEHAETRAASSDVPMKMVALWGIAPEQVPLYMNAANVMLMMSFTEGSPNVVKEAMACNLPVVGVPVGDVRQLIENVNGYAFCKRDAHEVADAMIKLISVNGIGGRQAIVERGLDLASVAERIVQIYQAALAAEIDR